MSFLGFELDIVLGLETKNQIVRNLFDYHITKNQFNEILEENHLRVMEMGFIPEGNKNDESRQRIIKKVEEFFQNGSKRLNSIDSVVLFGSYATKEYREERGIDLCIILGEHASRDAEHYIHKQFLDLSKKMDKAIDVLYVRPEEIEGDDHTTLETILAQGRLIFGSKEYEEIFLAQHQAGTISSCFIQLERTECIREDEIQQDVVWI